MNEFDQFWSVYPRRVAKAESKAEFVKARKRASFERIMAGAVQFRRHHEAAGTEPRFIMHARRWLKWDRWEDELETDDAERWANERDGNGVEDRSSPRLVVSK